MGIDLVRIDLVGVDFARIDLVGVDFVRIDLVGAPHVNVARWSIYLTTFVKRTINIPL